MKEFSELGRRIPHRRTRSRASAAPANMLGRQQHGHIEAIGFDMYCQMLEARPFQKLKGEESRPRTCAPRSAWALDVRIPQDYIPSENLRLRTLQTHLLDRLRRRQAGTSAKSSKTAFGTPPSSVENLLEYAALKSMCERLRISAVERPGDPRRGKVPSRDNAGPRPKLVSVVRSRTGIKLDPQRRPLDGGQTGGIDPWCFEKTYCSAFRGRAKL